MSDENTNDQQPEVNEEEENEFGEETQEECENDKDENMEDENDQDDDDDEDIEDGESETPYIRLRGLPWNVTNEEIIDFLKGAKVLKVIIVKNKTDGKSTGEAFVKLESPKDEEAAFKHDRENMGHRYIEIFNSSAEDVKLTMKKTRKVPKILRLRGLPFSVDVEMIKDFFDGLEYRKDREGIVIVTDRRGRPTGEAYVQFKTQLAAIMALKRNKQKIGHRYIEIFRSSIIDLKRALESCTVPYERPGGRGNFGRNRNRNRRSEGRNFGGRFNDNGFNNGGGRMNSGGGGFGFNNFGNNNGGGNFQFGFDGYNNGNNFGGGSYCIHMRGLPYYSYENDINDFFTPLRPVEIDIIYNKKGLHSGTADVYFSSADDAIQAMRKHKEQMGSRYIELFYDGNNQRSTRI